MTAFAKWRTPTREEYPAGMSELAKVVGLEESVAPSWTRRLVLAEPGGEWGLIVEEGGPPTVASFVPWSDPIQLQVFQRAYPIGEAIVLLQGPNNPEAILADRRRRNAEHEAELAAAKAQREAEAAEERARQQKNEELAQRFDAAGWYRLEAPVQLVYRLALLFEKRGDVEFAGQLRDLALSARHGHPAQFGFPGCKWDGP